MVMVRPQLNHEIMNYFHYQKWNYSMYVQCTVQCKIQEGRTLVVNLVYQNKNLLIICPLKNLYVPSTLHNVFGNSSPIIYFPTSLHISLSVLLITICMQQMMYTCTHTFYSAHHCTAAQFDYSRPIAMAQSPYMNEAINM